MCCQESGEREASVSLFCPRAKPGEKKFRKVRSSSNHTAALGRDLAGANGAARSLAES